MSKRMLLELVEGNYVDGWDDPRMPTICGLRRRGYTPESIRNFVEKVGIAKRDAITDVALLEHSIREDLNKRTQRVMAVLKPLKIVITNYPESRIEELEAINNPEDPSTGKRTLKFTRELYIESDDFLENPPKNFHRLYPGNEVRLKYAYIIKCNEVIKNSDGEITELHCTYFPETKSGTPGSTRKVKGTIHWVSVSNSEKVNVRLYDRLFTVENPAVQTDKDFKDFLNPDSLVIINNCLIEPEVLKSEPGDKYQFERLGYFCVDPLSSEEQMVFNRTVPLRDAREKTGGKK